MKKTFWLELSKIFEDNEELALTYKELCEMVKLVCEDLVLQDKREEISKKLQELNKDEK